VKRQTARVYKAWPDPKKINAHGHCTFVFRFWEIRSLHKLYHDQKTDNAESKNRGRFEAFETKKPIVKSAQNANMDTNKKRPRITPRPSY